MKYNMEKGKESKKFADYGVMEDIPEIRDLEDDLVEEDLPGVEVNTAFRATSKVPKLRG